MNNIFTFPPFYFFTVIILNFICYFLFPEFNSIPFPCNLVGIIAIIFGFHIANRSSNIFTKKKTTFRLEKPAAFVQNDFYKRSRNPMYLGGLILITGQAVLMTNVIALITPVLFFLFIHYLCIPPEEAIMKRTFGSEYIAYKQNVRRWL
jgi:protein-S-isoprenylcysteine O-methyltransferase Ste14